MRAEDMSLYLAEVEELMFEFLPESFTSQNVLGVMCLLPNHSRYGVGSCPKESDYPETKAISRLNSIQRFPRIMGVVVILTSVQ